MMDDPRHSQIRRLVSSGLTPRMIGRVEDDLRSRARRLLDDVEPGVPFDFLVDVAAELPMQMICILLGVPESERHWLFEAIEPQFDFGGSRRASVGAAVGRGGRVADVRLRPGADRVEAGRADRRHVVGGRQRRRLTTPMRRRCRTSSCTCSSACCSARAPRRRATRSPVGCWRWPSIPTSARAAGRSVAAADRGRGDGALDVAVAVEAAHRDSRRRARWVRRSRRARRCRSGRARPTATRRCSTRRRRSTSRGSPTRTWASVRVCTTAWVRTWRGWSCGCCSRRLLGAVLGRPGGQAGGVDAQQPAHRHPAPGRRTGSVRPDVFAAVMATGIVSIAAADHGYHGHQ